MALVRKHPVLLRQIGAAAIDQIQAGQPVLARDLLRAHVLLHRLMEEQPPLTVASLAMIMHGVPCTTPIPVTIPAAGTSLPYIPQRRQRRQLEERRRRIDQPVDAVAHQQLAALEVALARASPPPARASACARAAARRAPRTRRRCDESRRSSGRCRAGSSREAPTPRRGRQQEADQQPVEQQVPRTRRASRSSRGRAGASNHSSVPFSALIRNSRASRRSRRGIESAGSAGRARRSSCIQGPLVRVAGRGRAPRGSTPAPGRRCARSPTCSRAPRAVRRDAARTAVREPASARRRPAATPRPPHGRPAWTRSTPRRSTSPTISSFDAKW